MSDYAVDLEALRSDARRWIAWADDLAGIGELVPWGIDAAIFGSIVGVDGVHRAVTDGLVTLRRYVESGHAEFAGIAEALVRSADIYAANDGELSADARRTAQRFGLA